MNSTMDTVRKILSEHQGVYKGDITPASTLADLLFNEMDLVEIWMEIEKEFKFDLLYDEIDNLATVQDIVNFINKKIGA